MTDKKSLWNEAGKAGLILGCTSILYITLTGLLGKLESAPLLVSILDGILWIAKFVGCIWLMRFFMLRYAASEPDADNSDTFRFGMVTALLSALFFATYYLVYVLYIEPNTFSDAFEMARDTYSSMLDANTLDALEQMEGKMPTISFFTQLIYCWLFGTVLSAILSRNIPSRNPFLKDDSSNQE